MNIMKTCVDLRTIYCHTIFILYKNAYAFHLILKQDCAFYAQDGFYL